MRGRRGLISIALVAFLAACTGGSNAVDQQSGTEFRYQQSTPSGTVTAVSSRKLAGPVRGDLLTGTRYSLDQDRGHVVVLNYFATWCAPCQTETPQLDLLYGERKAAGTRFVGFDVKDSSQAGSRAWLQDKQISFPVVWDQPAKTAIELGRVPIASLPATILIDKQGRVAAVYLGVVLPKDLTPALDTLAKESA